MLILPLLQSEIQGLRPTSMLQINFNSRIQSNSKKATNDDMNNTAGSYTRDEAKMPADSTIARKLPEDEAIILGKTNPSQWGHCRPFSVSNGCSSGSAVAATLGLATVCLGAETSGSIIAPSHFNNIVGMKPTVGLISRHLVVPVSEHMDSIGPMTKTFRDSAYALEHRSTGSMLQAFNKSLAILRSAGAIIVENTDFPTAQESMDNGLLTVRIVAADFVVAAEKYLDLLVYNPHNIIELADLREWTQSSPLEGYPNKPTEVWDAALQDWINTDYEFWRAYQRTPILGQ
ncbi:hypothetical protein BHYA_0042g00260 [Botrytis hyacinthi]|uniref:Amidase domain-containing protein n=1 Tax=Botrytis hyacinthi TaxID=278943 RepID=A0A4Z1GWN6_9HELO|nr:hypothetical protein BHYA_0042g00260 [Botrytis hyacinthi]